MGNCFRGASLKTPAAPASDKINCPILDPIVRFSVKIVSDMVPKHQNSVICIGPHGPKPPKFGAPGMKPRYLLAGVPGDNGWSSFVQYYHDDILSPCIPGLSRGRRKPTLCSRYF